MPRPGDIDDVEVAVPDDAVQVHVEEIEAGSGAPVAEKTGLDVLFGKRLLQERIVHQVDLTDGKIVRRPPVSIHQFEFAF